MKIISTPIKKEEILNKYNHFFKKMVKAVVDVENKIIAVDAELHADLEEMLIENGSGQNSLWGINLYLENEKDDWLAYTALINIRPALGNNGMEIKNETIKKKVAEIVYQLIV